MHKSIALGPPFVQIPPRSASTKRFRIPEAHQGPSPARNSESDAATATHHGSARANANDQGPLPGPCRPPVGPRARQWPQQAPDGRGEEHLRRAGPQRRGPHQGEPELPERTRAAPLEKPTGGDAALPRAQTALPHGCCWTAPDSSVVILIAAMHVPGVWKCLLLIESYPGLAPQLHLAGPPLLGGGGADAAAAG